MSTIFQNVNRFKIFLNDNQNKRKRRTMKRMQATYEFGREENGMNSREMKLKIL